MQTVARAAVAALFLFTAGFPPDACGSGEADGTNLLHRVAEKYSTVTTLSATFRQEVPLQDVGGGGESTEYFRVEEANPLPGGKETVLRLVPKGDGAPEVRRVDLVVDDTDLTIRQVHLYARLGGAHPPHLARTRGGGGHRVVSRGGADVGIVNTCGFIRDAKEESIGEILALAREKQRGRIRRLVVAGCLARRCRG